MEWGKKKQKKNSRAAPGGDSRCKKGWQNVEQIFMDHERKSEKKITKKNKKKHTHRASFQQLELIVLDD